MRQTILRRGCYAGYVLLYFFFFFTMAAFNSVLSVYLTGAGKTAAEMSFIVSAASLFSLAVVPAAGFLCDRTVRPRLVSGLLLAAAGVMAVVFSQTGQVWALFLLNGLIMSCLNAVMPVCERLAGACRYRYGTLRVWGTFGYAAGAQAAGVAIQSFPPAALFVWVFFSALLAAAGFAVAENPGDASLPPDRKREPIRLSAFLRNPSFLLFALITLLFCSCAGTNVVYCPLLLSELGLSTGAVGTVLSVSTLMEIPLILFSHKFMDRFSGKALIIGNCLLALTQYTTYGLSQNLIVSAATLLLLKAVTSTLFVMLMLKMVRNLAPPELTTTGLSLINSISSLGAIALQNLSGILVDRHGVRFLYLVMSGIILFTLLTAAPLKAENREKVFG
ncbi:MAG: MFS transporter [Clostridiales bacterium]|nr:MFS transporter [Clostridiales bacterium]